MKKSEIIEQINAQQTIILDREGKLTATDYIAAKIAEGKATKEEYADKKSYDSLMNHALRARLAEACVSWIQHQVYDKHSKRVIRPAFGYPVCPDHSLKQILFQQLHAEERLGVRLTPQYSIQPSTTVCGLFIAHPEARYFTIGRIDEQQLADYCRRRGITFEEGRSLLDKYVIPPTTL